MSIMIDRERCLGCGKCRAICPGNLLDLDAQQIAFIREIRDCWGCCSCLKECTQQAIRLYLGADIGGRGGGLSVQVDEDRLTWLISLADGGEQSIVVQRRAANVY